MNFDAHHDPRFEELKAEIEAYSRLCGYYLIDLVSLPTEQDHFGKTDGLLDELFEYFDDREWPPPSSRPTDESWFDYERDREVATDHVVQALIGGRGIGHTRETMPPRVAVVLWERFESFVAEPRRYYIGMGLGDPRRAFSHGAAVVGTDSAALLWIVEDD